MPMNVLFVEGFRQSAIPVKIGLPYAYLALSGYLRRHSSRYQVTFHSYLLDGTLGKKPIPFAEILERSAPSVVMASAFTSTFGATHALLAEAKRYGATTVLGGILASADYENILRSHPEIDVAVVGEGEATCLEILDSLYEGRSLAGVAGIAHRVGDVVVFNGLRLQRTGDSHRLCLSDLSTLPIDAYRPALSRHYVFASSGCRFNCPFCTVSGVGRAGPSYRAPDDVVAEYSAVCGLFGPLLTSLADSNVTDNPRYYLDVCRALHAVAPESKLAVKGRVDQCSPELLTALKQSGVDHIAIGIESPLESQLALLGKTVHPSTWMTQVYSTLAHCLSSGLRVHFNLMLGVPGETEATLEEKAVLALRLHAEYGAVPFLSFFTPHPGTEIHRSIHRLGMEIVEDDLDQYDHLHPVAQPVGATPAYLRACVAAYEMIATHTRTAAINPVPGRSHPQRAICDIDSGVWPGGEKRAITGPF